MTIYLVMDQWSHDGTKPVAAFISREAAETCIAAAIAEKRRTFPQAGVEWEWTVQDPADLFVEEILVTEVSQ